MKLSKKIISLALSMALVLPFAPNSSALSNVQTIKGSNRYETAAIIADKQNCKNAILVNSDSTLVDGLSASGLSGAVNAPILLVKKNSIPDVTLQRLQNVENVYIIGNSNAISDSVKSQISSMGINVERIGGNDRYSTSYAVAKKISEITDVNQIILVNGVKGEADAMSVSPVACRDSSPIILTNGKSIPFSTNGIKTYVIGSSAVMSDSLKNSTNATRLGGKDRFETNKKIINHFYKSPTEFYLSNHAVLVDALTVSPIAKNTPVVLVKKGSDKSILKGATKLTALGKIDQPTINECIDAANGVNSKPNPPQPVKNMEVHFINVGQGDSTYIEMPDGTDILIDAGKSNAGDTVVNYLRSQEKNMEIDYLIATHPDADHIGGMQDVFKDLKIKSFYYPLDAPHNTKTWKNVLSLAKSEKCSINDAKTGTKFVKGGAEIKFVHPTNDYSDNNEDSVVALLDYNNTEVLLTGDAESITEQDMINQNKLVDVDVLKVGHHGSDTSTTQAFLNKVKPEYSVISVGKNSYGHPKASVLNRLKSIGSKIFRTDINGNVVLKTNGSNINFSTQH